MNRLIIAAAILPFILCACGKPEEPAPPVPVAAQVSPNPPKTEVRPTPVPSPAQAKKPPKGSAPTTKTAPAPSTGTTVVTVPPPTPSPSVSSPQPPSIHTTDQLVGTWKVDIALTTEPAPNDKAKAEQKALRLDLKKEGVYVLTGAGGELGNWAVEGNTLTLTSNTDGPRPPFIISADGTQLSATSADKKHVIVLIRA